MQLGQMLLPVSSHLFGETYTVPWTTFWMRKPLEVSILQKHLATVCVYVCVSSITNVTPASVYVTWECFLTGRKNSRGAAAGKAGLFFHLIKTGFEISPCSLLQYAKKYVLFLWCKRYERTWLFCNFCYCNDTKNMHEAVFNLESN